MLRQNVGSLGALADVHVNKRSKSNPTNLKNGNGELRNAGILFLPIGNARDEVRRSSLKVEGAT